MTHRNVVTVNFRCTTDANKSKIKIALRIQIGHRTLLTVDLAIAPFIPLKKMPKILKVSLVEMQTRCLFTH